MGAPVLIGAGVGAVGSALTGNNPFKGALLGGSLGAGYGGIQNMAAGGGFMEGAFPFMAETAKPAALETIAQGGGAFMPAYEAPIGMFNTFNPVTGEVVNAANLATEAANYSPSLIGAASQGGLTAAATEVPMMQKLGYTWDQVKEKLPDLTANNVIGGMNIAQKYMQKPQLPQAPSGGIKQGNAPQIIPMSDLLATASTPKQKKRISLLVG
jgi:hypothetical protein